MYGTNAESEADQLTRHTRASIILRSRSFIISIIDAFIYKVYLILHYFIFFACYVNKISKMNVKYGHHSSTDIKEYGS